MKKQDYNGVVNMMNDINNFNNENMHNVEDYQNIDHQKFREIYQNKIMPFLNKYEQERVSALIICIIVCSILAILGICFKSCLGFLISGVACGFWYKKKKALENKIKEEIMPTVCACLGNIIWEEHYHCDKKIIQEIGIVDNFDTDCYDDYFHGAYKDVNIEVIEAEYKRRYDDKNTITIFDGAIIILDLNKKFKGRTIVTAKGQKSSQEYSLKKTSLEDPEFNKKYTVFTNDEVEARYLLTPSFMERLKNIKNVFQAESVSCSFYQGKLYIALNTGKDLFAIGSLTKSVADPEPYYQMFDEIYSIMKLVDHFKLNEKTRL